MSSLQHHFKLQQLKEATIECSPDSLTFEKVKLFYDLGFNRLSLGAQSFDDKRLKRLGRSHNQAQIRQAVQWARQVGFTNISIDLMCAFPEETVEEVRHNVCKAIELNPDHVSLYPFRQTEGTHIRKAIDRGKFNLLIAHQKRNYYIGRQILMAHGYLEYAFGYFGNPVLFNFIFFQMRCDTIGFGSGAVSQIGQAYYTHVKGPLDNYIQDPLTHEVITQSNQDPFIISAIRTGLTCLQGISRHHWQRVVGETLEESFSRVAIQGMIQFLEKKGLVIDQDGARLPADSYSSTLIELVFYLLKPKTASVIASAS